MTLLTQRALRVITVLEAYRAGSTDILDAILPFFEPILAEFSGQVLEPGAFAVRVRNAYRWNFTADIVEELIPRFKHRSWIKVISEDLTGGVYQVTYENPNAAPPGPDEVQISQALNLIAQDFGDFIRAISPLSGFNRSTNDLSDILVEWLVSIDAYNENALTHKATMAVQEGGRLSIAADIPDASPLTSEERYLCARFVKHLHITNSSYIKDLCKIASVGLLTEVIQDFQHPMTMIDKTDVVVYLDGPVALDLLGVSGRAGADNIRPLVKKLQEIGAQIRIFRLSIEELKRALDAVLRRPLLERTGATADAIRRNETSEAYVRQVAADLDGALRRHRISIVERKIDQYPNEDEYFTIDLYENLFSRISWHYEPHPREHDSKVITFIQRMRKGNQSSDLFRSRHILVTRNGAFARLARRFCIDNELISSKTVSPVLHQRQLATALWLRTGLGDENEEIPRRYLLAACERVLELKRGIVDQVQFAGRNMTPEKAEQLGILLTQDRSVQLLMDKTLGISNVVSSSNIEQLVDVMKNALVADIEEKKVSEIATVKRSANSKIREANSRKLAAEQKANELQCILMKKNLEDESVAVCLVDKINRHVFYRKITIRVIIYILVFAIGSLPIVIENLTGVLKLSLLLFSGVVTTIFARFQLLDRPMRLERRLESWGRKMIEKYATERGLEMKMMQFEFDYFDGRFTVRNKRMAAEENQIFGRRPTSDIPRDTEAA